MKIDNKEAFVKVYHHHISKKTCQAFDAYDSGVLRHSVTHGWQEILDWQWRQKRTLEEKAYQNIP